MRYEDFIKVDQKFYSVFNREVDDQNPDLWKSFIPHRGFIEFLNKTVTSLNREKTQDTKSIWLYGSYGTGKTFAVFVLKHLLEDCEEDVEEYFSMYSQVLAPYREKINSLRGNKVLVVYKSSAGHVNSSIKLNLEIMHSLYEAYCRHVEKENINNIIIPYDIELLKDRIIKSAIDWDSFIKKHKSRLFYINSKDEILAKLEKGDLIFAANVIDCLKEEGFSHFAVTDVNKVKEWIEDLIQRGNFAKILFIWDEFSEFFTENAPIFTFQELAHLTQKIPFYLLIVTHRPIDFWESRFGEDIKKLKDRFINIHFTMENITMYKLMTFIIKPHDNSRWLDFKREIIHKLSPKLRNEIAKMINLDENLTQEDIERVFPIHPYSVYLITKIVEYFGSTNRTVFDFMKSDKGFVRFIKEYPERGEYLLTIDFLWDFFFAESSEISTFYPKVRKWINYWHMHNEKLESEEEKKVFKAICLLFTLKEEILISTKGDKLLKPTFPTLKLAFCGTNVYEKIYFILEKFDNIKIVKLYKPPFGDIEILEPTLDINQEELERVKAEIPDYPVLIKKNITGELFKIHRRANMDILTDEELIAHKIPFINNKGYSIQVYFIVIKEGRDIKQLKEKTREISKNFKNSLFIVSTREIKEEEIKKLREELAFYKYYTDQNQHNQARYHYNNFQEILRNCIENLKRGDFFINISYDNGEFLEKHCSGLNSIEFIFKKEIIPKIFPYSLEERIISDPLWSNKNLNKKAINYAIEPTQADKSFSVLINELIHAGFLDNNRRFIEDSLNKNYDHTITKINDLIQEKLSEYGEVNLSSLWEELNKPPFGIYDVPVGVFCFAFVLRNYIKNFYVIDQQGYEIELNSERLKEIIEDTIKGKKIWSLRALSKEQQKFCEFLNSVFDLNTKTPRDAIIMLREKIRKEIKYPLWMANYTELVLFTPAKELLNSLSNLILTSYEEKIENLNSQFRKFYDAINSYSGIELDHLIIEIKEIVSTLKDCFKNVVSKYINLNEKISINKIEDVIKERLQEDTYLWKEDSFLNLLETIKKEVCVVGKISEILNISDASFISELAIKIRELIKKGKLAPLWIYEKYLKDKNFSLLQLLFNPNVTFKDLVDSNLIQNLYDSMNLFERIFNDFLSLKDQLVREWIKERFEITSDSLLSHIENEFWKLIYADPTLSEEQINRELRSRSNELKEKSLRDEILNILKNSLGVSSFRDFLINNKIPINLLYYLPELTNSELRGKRDFFNNLLNMDKLTGISLEDLRESLLENKHILEIMAREDFPKKLLRIFLGKEWDEMIFDNQDFENFLKFYKVSNVNIYSSEREVLDIFDQWKSIKYDELLPKLEKDLYSAQLEVLREVLLALLKKPEVGFNIIKIMKSMNIDI